MASRQNERVVCSAVCFGQMQTRAASCRWTCWWSFIHLDVVHERPNDGHQLARRDQQTTRDSPSVKVAGQGPTHKNVEIKFFFLKNRPRLVVSLTRKKRPSQSSEKQRNEAHFCRQRLDLFFFGAAPGGPKGVEGRGGGGQGLK